MTAQINGFKLHIADTEEQLFADLAHGITQLAKDCIAKHGIFSFALSGGQTPRDLYSNLARLPEGAFPWTQSYLFLGDERCLPTDNSESNYKMISDTLLCNISIPSTNVFPTINPHKDPEGCSRRYEQAIRRFFKLDHDVASGNRSGFPRFSLVLLGVGPDGHTASLFKDSPALKEESRLFMPNHPTGGENDRLTMTKNVIASANKVYFLVTGESKAVIVRDIFGNPGLNLPAQMVANQCKREAVEWYMDKPAAKFLKL